MSTLFRFCKRRWYAAGPLAILLLVFAVFGVRDLLKTAPPSERIVEKEKVRIKYALDAPMENDFDSPSEFWINARIERVTATIEAKLGAFQNKPTVSVVDSLPPQAKPGYNPDSKEIYIGRDWPETRVASELTCARLDEKVGLDTLPVPVVEGLGAYFGSEALGYWSGRFSTLYKSDELLTLSEIDAAFAPGTKANDETREKARTACLVIVYDLLFLKGLSFDDLLKPGVKLEEPKVNWPNVLTFVCVTSHSRKLEVRAKLLEVMFTEGPPPSWSSPFPIKGSEAEKEAYLLRCEVGGLLLNDWLHEAAKAKDWNFSAIEIRQPLLPAPDVLFKKVTKEHLNNFSVSVAVELLRNTPGDSFEKLRKLSQQEKPLERAELATPELVPSKDLFRRIQETGKSIVFAELARGGKLDRLAWKTSARMSINDWDIIPELEESRDPADLIRRGIELPKPKQDK